MAATAQRTAFSTHSTASTSSSSFNLPKRFLRFTLTLPSIPKKPTCHCYLRISISLSNPSPKPAAASTYSIVIPTTTGLEAFASCFALDEPRKGADILVEALERQGVTNVFAYPGGASMEIHQALTRSNIIRNVLPRHEQGGVFAAEGYARSSGLPGVCIATSGPSATNLVSVLADASLDSHYRSSASKNDRR